MAYWLCTYWLPWDTVVVLTGCHGVDADADDHDERHHGADGEHDLHLGGPFHVEAVHDHQGNYKHEREDILTMSLIILFSFTFW